MAVTVKDVAKLAGVSTATVSRTINNDPRLSDKTRAKVLRCMEELDYKVNSIARGLKTNKTYTIGFICPELANTFFMTVAKGVEDELRKHGYSVIVCNSNENIAEEKERIRLLCEKCVDGVIIIPSTGTGAHFKQLSDENIPVVLVDRLVEDFTADAVLADNINGSYSAVEYLINQGERRIGYIGGDLKLTSASERDEGYRRALKDYCIPVEDDIIKYGDFHIRSGYEKMKELIEMDNPPSYVFIMNYYMHAGATRYLTENRDSLRHPVRIASFDDMEMAAVFGYCKLLVGQPMLDMGNKAAQILLGRMSGDSMPFPQVYRLKTSLLIKE